MDGAYSFLFADIPLHTVPMATGHFQEMYVKTSEELKAQIDGRSRGMHGRCIGSRLDASAFNDALAAYYWEHFVRFTEVEGWWKYKGTFFKQLIVFSIIFHVKATYNYNKLVPSKPS